MDSIKKEVSIVDDHLLPTVGAAAGAILVRLLFTILWVPISLSCLPLFLIGLCVWGLPPTIPPFSRFCKYFIATITEGNVEDNIPISNRVLVFCIILSILVKAPVNGVCWFIDEILFSGYHKINIEDPVFYITGTRSGSTQLCEYLEDDVENFIIPMSGEGLFPLIWVWKLIVPILKLVGMGKHVDAPTDMLYGAEVKKRHNASMLRTESLDILAGVFHHTYLSWYLGWHFMKWGMPFSKVKGQIDEQFCDSNFHYVNALMKKVMYSRGRPSQRMLVKGHFLKAAHKFEKQYPKAKFFTTARQPEERFRSLINFMMTISTDGPPARDYALFPVSWKVLRNYVIDTQSCFCEQEMSFFKHSQGKKLAIPFTVYVDNLGAALKSIYVFCNISVPADVVSKADAVQTTTHNRQRRRSSYKTELNKGWEELGVDEEKLSDHLTEYNNWIEQLDESKKSQ